MPKINLYKKPKNYRHIFLIMGIKKGYQKVSFFKLNFCLNLNNQIYNFIWNINYFFYVIKVNIKFV